LKKTYVLNIEGKQPARLLDASKHDIRKYVKRERAKALPEGADFWDFDCKVGTSDASSTPVHVAEIMTAVDALVKDGANQFFVEITSKPGHRAARPVTAADTENTPEKSEIS
jgi:acetoin utilization deacetylase AcuC-like enzyme